MRGTTPFRLPAVDNIHCIKMLPLNGKVQDKAVSANVIIYHANATFLNLTQSP